MVNIVERVESCPPDAHFVLDGHPDLRNSLILLGRIVELRARDVNLRPMGSAALTLSSPGLLGRPEPRTDIISGAPNCSVCWRSRRLQPNGTAATPPDRYAAVFNHFSTFAMALVSE